MPQNSAQTTRKSRNGLYAAIFVLIVLAVAYFTYQQYQGTPTPGSTITTTVPTTVSNAPPTTLINQGAGNQQTVPYIVNRSALQLIFGVSGNYTTGFNVTNAPGSNTTFYGLYFVTDSKPASIFTESIASSPNINVTSQYASTQSALRSFYNAEPQGLIVQVYNGSASGFTYEKVLITSINGTSSNMVLIGYKGSLLVTVNVGSTISTLTQARQTALVNAVANSS